MGRVMAHLAGSRLRTVFLAILAATIAVSLTGCERAAATGEPPGPRTLFIALDGIDYQTVAHLLAERPLFAGFHPPVAVVSTFPAQTNPAFTGLFEPFGVAPAPGYEARFFDRRENEVRGGGMLSYGEIRFPWKELFDWRPALVPRTFGNLDPVQASIGELETALDDFARSDRRRFFAYVPLSDAARLFVGPAGAERILTRLDAMLVRFRARHPGEEFRTVLFSDHGNAGGEVLANVRTGVKQALARAGWHLGDRLEGRRDLVLVDYGLISSFELYTQPDAGWEAARAVVGVDGVDLCVTPTAEGWRVVSSRGDALVERRLQGGEEQWAYRPLDGDPLGYAPVVEELRRRAGAAAGRRWFGEEAWFEATREHHYPDALYRLARAFDLVANPASAVCSLAPGSIYGSSLTQRSADLSVGALRWTHGALYRETSLAFLLTDDPGWTPRRYLRFDVALAPFAEEP